MKKFWADFKAFVTRGNVVELAVAVIIGAAFNKITTSLVNDVIMPIISLAVGGLSVDDWKWVITPEVVDASGTVIQAENALRYGALIQTMLDFMLIALIVFLILRGFQSADRKLQTMAKQAKMLSLQQRRELKKQGKTRKEIKQINQELYQKHLEEEKQKQLANKKPTTEELLTQIRDLLAQLPQQAQQTALQAMPTSVQTSNQSAENNSAVAPDNDTTNTDKATTDNKK